MDSQFEINKMQARLNRIQFEREALREQDAHLAEEESRINIALEVFHSYASKTNYETGKRPSIRQRIIDCFEIHRKEMSTREVVEILSKDEEVKLASVAADISKFSRDGVLVNVGEGKYRLKQSSVARHL